jgi:tRNA G18 (ribose-2'-O)-methylase SpoU
VRGYFGIGIERTKAEVNIGTLWRSAYIFGASFIFTVGRRYKKQSSDTVCAWRHIPLYHFLTADEFYGFLPYDCRLVGVELDERAKPIRGYVHPQRAVYILGAEDVGLSPEMIGRCHELIVIPGDYSLNVAVAGSIVMFDRINKRE